MVAVLVAAVVVAVEVVVAVVVAVAQEVAVVAVAVAQVNDRSLSDGLSRKPNIRVLNIPGVA